MFPGDNKQASKEKSGHWRQLAHFCLYRDTINQTTKRTVMKRGTRGTRGQEVKEYRGYGVRGFVFQWFQVSGVSHFGGFRFQEFEVLGFQEL